MGRVTKTKKVVGLEGELGSAKKPKSDLVMPKLPPNGYPTEYPFNKDGFHYILAEPDPHAPFRQEFDESQDYSGKPIPGWLYRKLEPSVVLLALHDRAPQLRVSEDRLSVSGEKGYCMIRATHGVNYGTWYYEVTMNEMPDNSAARLGWSQGLGNLQGPCGYDKVSFAWRSRKGTKFTESRGVHYTDIGYKQGDVVGCLIHLSEANDTSDVRDGIPVDVCNRRNYLPKTHKDRPLVKFKNYLYFEEKDENVKSMNDLAPLLGSKMAFYRNGEFMGTAFENVPMGIYYPAGSFYKNVTATFNFGPNFKHPPKDVSYRGLHEMAEESESRQTLCDLVYFAENDGKLRLEKFYGTN